MIKKTVIGIIAAAALIAGGCTHVVKTPTERSAGDFSVESYCPSYASGFRLMSLPEDSTARMLEVYTPDTMRVVIPEGGFRRIVAMSSTYVAHLEAAGRSDRLVGASSPEYISSAEVRAMNLPDVGYDGAMNYELLLSLKPELVMIYGIGGASPMAPKLDELGIPYVYISDFNEQTPLGRAEWAVATAALAGADFRDEFRAVESNYRPEQSGNVQVMLNAPYGGSWFIPGREGFMSRLIADAGGRIVAPQVGGTDSRPIDIEEALPALSRADVWLCPGAASTGAELSALVPKARFSGPVWNQTPDFYENGSVRPDSVLGELKMILAGVAPADSLRYFYRVK